MANKVVNYKKFRTDIINGKKRCIYMKPKGKREYVKSKGEFVLLSVYIKKMQKKMKIKRGGDKSFVGPTRPSQSLKGPAKYPWSEPHSYYGTVYANNSDEYKRPLSNKIRNALRNKLIRSRAYMEGFLGKKKFPTLLDVDESNLELPPHPKREKSYYPDLTGRFDWYYPGKSAEWQEEHRYKPYNENAKEIENKNRIEAFQEGQNARKNSKIFPLFKTKRKTQNSYDVSADLVFANTPNQVKKLTVGHA